MNTISKQKTKVLYNPQQIDQCVYNIAISINKTYSQQDENNIVFCPILQGVVPFFADLIKYIEIEPYVEYLGISSYKGTEKGDFLVYKMPDPSIVKDKTIWVFDDIADSGDTLRFVKETLISYGALDVKTCTLLKKDSCTYPVDLYGFPLKNDNWIHGYGLDAPNGRGRTAPALYSTTLK